MNIPTDPNCPDGDGYGPLGCAASKGHEGVVKLLLAQENIDPNRPDIYGQTPLVLATLKGHGRVVNLLRKQENVDPSTLI